jgi:L-lactate dehydrogenase complex protein LldF
MIRNRSVYDIFLRMASIGQKILPKNNGMIRRLPPPMNGWTKDRDIRPVADESFIKRWKKGL